MLQSKSFDIMREHLHRRMMAAVSHDLKTPLATVIGSLEIYERMEEKLTKEKRSSLIKSALGEAYRLDNFISNILDMAKLEEGNIKIHQQCCNLDLIIKDCIINLGSKRSNCDIKIKSIKGNGLVDSDPVLLGRAIGLILDNAMKHSNEKPLIQITHSNDDNGFKVSIQDNGSGIPAGKENEIFFKYSRFSKGDQHNAGTGLGLAICRQLITMQGGNIHVENISTGGALFTIEFSYSKLTSA